MTLNHQADADLTPVISRERFDAVIFNLDGVVTDVNKIHSEAWKQLFDEFLQDCPALEGEDLRPFHDDLDYRRYVEGRARHSGVKNVLSSRHIELPLGEPDDPADRETVYGLGNRKKHIFNELLEQRDVLVYGCAIALIHRLRNEGFKTAMVSASRHCDTILQKAELSDRFDARVDGIEAERLDLGSKPDPYVLWEAARRLQIDPEQIVVIEDSVVGVTASSRGRFGLTIGIDDGEQRTLMLEHGADYVLEDLCRLHVGRTSEGDAASPPVLAEMEMISNQLTDKQPALFLDYGGTLTPNIRKSEDVELSKKMWRALQKAAQVMPVTIVSGRDVEELRDRVGLPELIYAGSHGLEIQGQDLHLELPDGIDILDDLDKAMAELTSQLAGFPGVRIQRKRFAIVVHYEKKDAINAAYVEAIVEQVQRGLPRLRKTGGKEVFELLPNIDWDKGRAVKWLLAELGLDGPDTLPLYIGDDVTDEDAFRNLQGAGIGILVAKHPQPSEATYRVGDSDDVLELLNHLIQVLKRKH
mgnify:CR=1 FL=1